MSEGFRHTLTSTGRHDRVIMLRSGSDAELSSSLGRDQVTLVALLPGVARAPEGHPSASSELLVMVALPRKGQMDPHNVPFRGVQPAAFAIRNEIKIVNGRRFKRGVPLNCMYSAIASRQIEIATLRAIGFSGTPVVVSVMIEAVLLALIGGVLGAVLAYLYCDGASLSTLNFSTFSQVAFDFRVTPHLMAQGLLWAMIIGMAGGLLPAIQAARLPVTVALRTL